MTMDPCARLASDIWTQITGKGTSLWGSFDMQSVDILENNLKSLFKKHAAPRTTPEVETPHELIRELAMELYDAVGSAVFPTLPGSDHRKALYKRACAFLNRKSSQVRVSGSGTQAEYDELRAMDASTGEADRG